MIGIWLGIIIEPQTEPQRNPLINVNCPHPEMSENLWSLIFSGGKSMLVSEEG